MHVRGRTGWCFLSEWFVRAGEFAVAMKCGFRGTGFPTLGYGACLRRSESFLSGKVALASLWIARCSGTRNPKPQTLNVQTVDYPPCSGPWGTHGHIRMFRGTAFRRIPHLEASSVTCPARPDSGSQFHIYIYTVYTYIYIYISIYIYMYICTCT